MNSLSFFRAMHQEMDKHAIDVWNMVKYSRSSGYRLRLGEVTLTELGFYHLRNYWTKGVYIQTNEPHEKTTGADWEWIIGHGDKWVQIRVQAKIINRSGSFPHLSHGPAGARKQQMNRLIDPPSADVACRWVPIYVFYTATPPAALLPQPVTGPFDERMGCSAHLARDVRTVYGPNSKGRATLSAKNHLPRSVAWSRVFDGLIARLSNGESLATIVDSLANQKLPSTVTSIDDFWNEKFTDGTCTGGLPAYIQAIIERRDDDFDVVDLATLQIDAPPPAKVPPTVPRAETRSELPRTKLNQELAVEGSTRQSRRGDEGELLPLSSRRLTLDRPDTEEALSSLPNFVSVIDIDRLPDIPQ